MKVKSFENTIFLHYYSLSTLEIVFFVPLRRIVLFETLETFFRNC